MATAYKQPDAFSPGENPAENWLRWRQRYEIYYDVADVEKKVPKKQISDLLHCLGDEGLAVYNALNLPEDADRLPKVILDAISTYYIPFKNTTYIRWLFFSEQQQVGQSIDQYVLTLRNKIKDCEFGELTDSLLRDRLIGGIIDTGMRERLLKDHGMTLDKAVNLLRANESSKIQTKVMSGTEYKTVDAINRYRPKQNTGNNAPRSQQNSSNKQNQVPKQSRPNLEARQDNACSRCGSRHNYRECPAYGRTCHKCGRLNHYATVCTATQKQLHTVDLQGEETEQADSEEEYYVESLNLQVDTVLQAKDNEWLENIMLNGTKISFKLDSGSQVNVISFDTYNRLKVKPALLDTKAKISAYTGHGITLKGKCTLDCQVRGQSQSCEFYVTCPNYPPILGKQACEELGLLQRVIHTTSRRSPCSPQDIVSEYEDVFKGVGKLSHKHSIQLDKDAKPQVHSARKIPISLKAKLKDELDKMEQKGIIVKENDPTDWVHPVVIVSKPNGSIRVCMDPRALNKFVKREHFQLPTSETIFSELEGATVFSVLDASSAFWQIPLTTESSKLCTIATPFGRYRFLRLPFGINNAPEVLQKEIYNLIEGIEGVKCYLDDIIISGKNMEEHNERLKAVLDRARKLNFRFSKDKLQLGVRTIDFLGHKVTTDGISIHKAKIDAINSIKQPENQVELQRFLGMINFLGKFIPNLSEKTHFLRQLLHKDKEWLWDAQTEASFNLLKTLITTAPVLAFFDKTKPIVLSVDASQYGLGAVLLQNDRPIAYASATLTPCQQKMAQIEKEMLAIVFGCERFHFYLYGMPFTVQTDHKPLLGIVTKPLEAISPRLQRLLLRFMRYSPELKHVPGKELYAADTLSRVPSSDTVNTDYLQGEGNAVHCIVSLSDSKTEALKQASDDDEELQMVKHYIDYGWPPTGKQGKQGIEKAKASPYWMHKDEIHVKDGLFFKGNQLIIPKTQRQKTLTAIHIAHQGVGSCQAKAKEAIYWPGMDKDIKTMILACETCQSYSRSNTKEPLLPQDIPKLPWDKVGVDFLKADNKTYMLVTDYHSKFVEIREMSTTTAPAVIKDLKQIFRTHGIPSTLISDNGPPFDSHLMDNFTSTWDIHHVTSSPTYPKSNGMAERAIGTIKGLIIKAVRSGRDPDTSIMMYNSTPKADLPSPAQMLMGRRLRTFVPASNKLRKPLFPTEKVWKTLQNKQLMQKEYYDNGSKPLIPLTPGQPVLIEKSKRSWIPGTVLEPDNTPRSYKVQTPEGTTLRRSNRSHLRPRPMIQSQLPLNHGQSTTTPDGERGRSPQHQSAEQSQQPVPVPYPDSEMSSVPEGSPTTAAAAPITDGRTPPSLPSVEVAKKSRSGRIINLPSRYKT
jgi:RNase H-like domain found in reverse transcriptase/Reverse transcriptase (RNA-dependent DNA polymerase)/Integrase zinc binding domain